MSERMKLIEQALEEAAEIALEDPQGDDREVSAFVVDMADQHMDPISYETFHQFLYEEKIKMAREACERCAGGLIEAR